MKTTRPYRMAARAAAAEATRTRILDAAVGAFAELAYDEITLARVAATAGVSGQTVINHFGGKDGLMRAAFAHAAAQIESRRNAPEAGDVPALVAALVDDYEVIGDAAVRVLALEGRVPGIDEMLAHGRRAHRDWCRAKLGARDEVLPLVVAATDVYVWRLLRRDQGLDRDATARGILRLVAPLLDQEV